MREVGGKSGDSNQWSHFVGWRLVLYFPRKCSQALHLHSHREPRAQWIPSCSITTPTFIAKVELWTVRHSHGDPAFLWYYDIPDLPVLPEFGIGHLCTTEKDCMYKEYNTSYCNTEARINILEQQPYIKKINWHNTILFLLMSSELRWLRQAEVLVP